MKSFILSIYLLNQCMFLVNVQAQTKKLTMEDAVLGQRSEFYPETLRGLAWRGNSNQYAYRKGIDLFTAQPGKEAQIITSLENINTALETNDIKPLKSLSGISWLNFNTVQLYSDNHYVQFNVESKKIALKIQFDKKAENQNFCEANGKLAYTIDNNLYISGQDNEKIAITSDQDKNMVNGQTVSRNEYGISGGIFWSSKGDRLAFYRKDESKVSTFPLLDINTRVGELREIKYPMAGMDSEKISLGVYNLDTGNTIWVKVDDFNEDRYLTNISWDNEGKYIYIQVVNRKSNHMKLNQYNAANGELVQTLFEEKDDRWVEPSHKLLFLKKGHFIYQTNNRHGFNHMYLYDTEGKLIKQLTSGEWEVTEILGFDQDENHVFYISTEVSPLDRHAYKLNLKTGKKLRLTKDGGYHDVQVSADGKYILDNYSSLHVPRKIVIANDKGKVVEELVNADNKLKDFNLGEISLGQIKAADEKTDLYYRMVKPANFDPAKKYPVVVYVYGGPHLQLVRNRWLGSARLWEQYMAQNGYLLFILDNRGSAYRGKEFETVIHRQCGQPEMADQVKGVEFLKSLPYVDAERIGVHGWSYGGFMTISLMTNYPDVFKTGVAGGPVIDWKWYEVMYGERYMDTPEENPDGYKKTSLLNKVRNLKGKLLICQGAIDDTVVWQHSLNFIRKCIKNNIQVDYFPYPRAEHNVRGRDRIHLKQKISNYFDDYLLNK